MKIARVTTLLILLSAISAAGQDGERLSQCPAAFRKFYAGFVLAVTRDDAVKVASMTRFPLKWGFDAGDEGTYTRRQFLRNYSRLFGENTTNLVDESNPLCFVASKKTIVITSEDALSLSFENTRAGFKLTAYVVEP